MQKETHLTGANILLVCLLFLAPVCAFALYPSFLMSRLHRSPTSPNTITPPTSYYVETDMELFEQIKQLIPVEDSVDSIRWDKYESYDYYSYSVFDQPGQSPPEELIDFIKSKYIEWDWIEENDLPEIEEKGNYSRFEFQNPLGTVLVKVTIRTNLYSPPDKAWRSSVGFKLLSIDK